MCDFGGQPHGCWLYRSPDLVCIIGIDWHTAFPIFAPRKISDSDSTVAQSWIGHIPSQHPILTGLSNEFFLCVAISKQTHS